MQTHTTGMNHGTVKKPCHDTDTHNTHSEIVQALDQMADDADCGCGHCTISINMVLLPQQWIQHPFNMHALDAPIEDFMKSIPPFSIEYPPQQIS